VDQRLQFLAEYQAKETTIIDLCRQFGISRPTAYKWIKRYEQLGPEGLLETQPTSEKLFPRYTRTDRE
jgi:transposase-like protein